MPHDRAIGLQWRKRKGLPHKVAVWVANRDLVKKGFRPKTVRLWPPVETPQVPFTDDVDLYLRSECARLQSQMQRWAHGGMSPLEAPVRTLDDLIGAYQSDPDSPYHRLRYRSRRSYARTLKILSRTVGKSELAAIRGRDFSRWYEKLAEPKVQDEPRRLARAHACMTLLRIICDFGAAIIENAEALRLANILDKLEFKQPRARKQAVTAEHVIAVRKQAHADGIPSIALASAVLFELMIRPKDGLGEWLPLSEPGLSTVHARGKKWLYGIDWREISPTLILAHRLSKSLKGRDAINDPGAGKTKVWDLKLYPMIMEELAHIPPEKRTGPLIVDERWGVPYADDVFAERWRKIADKVGVPKDVQFRDHRAGSITEAIEATDGNVEMARKGAGHAKIDTTLRYSRGDERSDANLAKARAAHREPSSNANANAANPGDDKSRG